jgi:hypothetical protein
MTNYKDELDKLITLLQEKPLVFLGEKSLEKLQTYIDGFLYAFSIVNNTPISFYSGFNDWIAKKYKLPAQIGWCNIIVLFHGKGETSYNKFFELLSEYKQSNAYKKQQ